MESQSLRTVVRRLRQAVAPSVPVGPDAELVRAFAGRREHGAFEQIVRRHGPMVLGVCRRVLHDAVDADDAFQATFLVLFRRAGSLRHPDRLAGWLHGVARRTSRKLRAIRLTRMSRESRLFDMAVHEPPAEFIWRELRPIFDQELDRLPEKLRLPAVLCFLEGHSKSAAARSLGWPEGTLSGRLQQARERLRVRFAARGLTLSTGALGIALFESVGSAAVPDRLLISTFQIAATGKAGALASAGACALADGVTQAMFMTKLKTLAAAMLVASVIGTGTGVVLAPGSGSGEVVAGEPTKGAPTKDDGAAPKGGKPAILIDPPSKDPERAKLQAELEQLIDRVAFEERMVKKGFMTATQLQATKARLASAEAELAKLDAPKAPDPRRAALEDLIRKMEDIVEQTRQGVSKGIMPTSELLNAELRVLEYKFKLAEMTNAPAPAAAKPSDAKRAAMEELVRKLEVNLEKTRDAVRKGIVPQQELLDSERTLLEYKFKLAELTDAAPAVDPRADRAAQKRSTEVERFNALLTQADRDLARAEALLKKGLISQAEVQRLRTDRDRLKADVAAATGDDAAAVKAHEALVTETAAELAQAHRLAKLNAISQAEVRALEIAVATAKVEAMKAGIRQQLATIVAHREQELAQAKKLFDANGISAADLHKAERLLAEAVLRLAEARSR